MKVEFYGLKWSAPCWTVLNLGHHLGLEFTFHEINVMIGEQLEEEFIKINPQHCIPTIIDGDFIMWESRAILQYLANKYDSSGTLYPIEPVQRAEIDQKLYFDMTLFAKAKKYYFAQWLNLPFQDPDFMKALVKQVEFLDYDLKDQKYATGNKVTIADFSLATTVTMMELGQFPFKDYSNICKWLKLCKETVPYLFTNEEAQGIMMEKIEAANIYGITIEKYLNNSSKF